MEYSGEYSMENSIEYESFRSIKFQNIVLKKILFTKHSKGLYELLMKSYDKLKYLLDLFQSLCPCNYRQNDIK